MSNPRSPESTDPSGSSRDEVADLVRSIEERESERIRDETSSPERATSPVWYLLLAVALVMSGYLWLARPAWVFGPSGGASTEADPTGRLRYLMYVQASRIESYRRIEGRLPDRLDQVQGEEGGLEYRTTADDGWELEGRFGDTRLVLRSTDSMADFLEAP